MPANAKRTTMSAATRQRHRRTRLSVYASSAPSTRAALEEEGVLRFVPQPQAVPAAAEADGVEGGGCGRRQGQAPVLLLAPREHLCSFGNSSLHLGLVFCEAVTQTCSAASAWGRVARSCKAHLLASGLALSIVDGDQGGPNHQRDERDGKHHAPKQANARAQRIALHQDCPMLGSVG